MLQAFNTAKINIDSFLSSEKYDRPLAIITDVDETVLDNSPYDGAIFRGYILWQKLVEWEI